MKCISFFIFILLFASAVAAVSSDIKDSYAPKETIISEIYGNVLRQIDKSQIVLRGEKGEEVAFDGDIKRFEGRHFLWLRAPTNQGNYTINIIDIIENVDGYPDVVDYKKSFSVSGQTVDYAIRPGAIFAASDFIITASLFSSAPIQITSDFPSQREITIRPGDNTLGFSIANVQGAILKFIQIGKYSVPSYILGSEKEEGGNNQTNNEQNNTQEGNQSNQEGGNNQTNNEQNNTQNFNNQSERGPTQETENQQISFNPGFIRGTIFLSNDRRPSYHVGLANKGDSAAQNITFVYNKEKFLISPENNFIIAPNQSIEINLTVIKITDVLMRGVVLVKLDDRVEDYLFMQFNVTTNETDVKTEYLRNSSEQVSSYYCSELSGFLCGEGETCEGQQVESIEGQCCLLKCTPPASNSKSWIGYVIAAVLVVIVALIYSRYKKAKSPKINPIENILSREKKA